MYVYFLKQLQVYLPAIFHNLSIVLQLKQYLKSVSVFSLCYDNLFPPQLH